MPSAPKRRLGYTLGQLEERVNAGLMQAHVFSKCAVITQIDDYPEERILHIVYLSGKGVGEDEQEQKTMLERLKEFARNNGCDAIECDCRPGLAEALKSHGFRRTKIIMRTGL